MNGRFVAGADTTAQLPLAFAREQRDAADVSKVHSERIVQRHAVSPLDVGELDAHGFLPVGPGRARPPGRWIVL
jgi:hypothetical protein